MGLGAAKGWEYGEHGEWGFYWGWSRSSATTSGHFSQTSVISQTSSKLPAMQWSWLSSLQKASVWSEKYKRLGSSAAPSGHAGSWWSLGHLTPPRATSQPPSHRLWLSPTAFLHNFSPWRTPEYLNSELPQRFWWCLLKIAVNNSRQVHEDELIQSWFIQQLTTQFPEAVLATFEYNLVWKVQKHFLFPRYSLCYWKSCRYCIITEVLCRYWGIL